MRVLSNINYKFYYYCFFYLSFFKEQKVLCVSKKIEKHYKYFKVDLNDCIDTEILELFFFNWWNHINSRFQFEKMRRYLVSNQLWDEQKSFFSLWKRSVNNVRVKIRCHETRMSWAVKNIKESSFLIIRSAIYYWNRRQYSDCLAQSFCCWFFWSFNDSLITINSFVWLWCSTRTQ